MVYMRSRGAGFTIVELLIVIVVIGILASITIVAYNGVQGRARDARRVQDLTNIVQSLGVYRANIGSYPNAVSTSGASGWEVSTDGTNATDFISALHTSGTVSTVPVDPKNYGVAGSLVPSRSSSNYEYFYYKYTAGSYGCDASRGDFYVLGATRMDTVASGSNYATSPGFSCASRDWATAGAWVTGEYTN